MSDEELELAFAALGEMESTDGTGEIAGIGEFECDADAVKAALESEISAVLSVAEENPAMVARVAESIIDIATDESLTTKTRTRALCAFGLTLHADLDLGVGVLAELAPLLDTANMRLSANAAAVFCDVSAVAGNRPPEQVSEYVGELSPLLTGNVLARKNATKALRRVGDDGPSSISALWPEFVQLLDDEDDAVRAEACRALGYLGFTQTLQPLRETARTDTDTTVRRWAGWACNQILDRNHSCGST